MSEDFTCHRRDVDWLETQITPIATLLDALELTKGKTNWGYGFRFGMVRITDHDRDVILTAMARNPPE